MVLSDIQLVKMMCDKFGMTALQNLSWKDFFDSKIEVLEYIIRKGCLKDDIDNLFWYSIRAKQYENIKFFHRLGANYTDNSIHDYLGSCFV